MDTIQRIKATRLHVTRFLCGQPLKNSAIPSLGLDKEGLPRCLGPLKDLVRSTNPNDLRLLMTLLRVSSILKARGKVDLTPITAPSTVKIDSKESIQLKEDVSSTIQEMGLEGYIQPEWAEYHLTTKTSPSTGPAMVAALKEVNAIPDNLLQDISVMGGQDLLVRIKKLQFLCEGGEVYDNLSQPK